MADAEQETNYPIFVSERDGVYDFRIRELVLKVSGTDLRQVYDELLKRKQAIIDYARDLGSLDELPRPAALPPLGPKVRAFGFERGIFSRVCSAWARLF
jgi:hypothetical protein